VEMGAIWSVPKTPAPGHKQPAASRMPGDDSVLHAGHFMIQPTVVAAATSGAKSVAASRVHLPAWFTASLPLRFKEGY